MGFNHIQAPDSGSTTSSYSCRFVVAAPQNARSNVSPVRPNKARIRCSSDIVKQTKKPLLKDVDRAMEPQSARAKTAAPSVACRRAAEEFRTPAKQHSSMPPISSWFQTLVPKP